MRLKPGVEGVQDRHSMFAPPLDEFLATQLLFAGTVLKIIEHFDMRHGNDRQFRAGFLRINISWQGGIQATQFLERSDSLIERIGQAPGNMAYSAARDSHDGSGQNPGSRRGGPAVGRY